MARSFFRPTPSWDMDTAKAYLEKHRPGTYNLIDVRQPEEFEEGHIPGATLIPLGELPGRLGEIDSSLPTLVYCRAGGRAGNATALLVQSGFKEARNIGGILQWRGLEATGAPEAGMAVFDAARTSGEYVILASQLEEGARLFYVALGEAIPDLEAMFSDMARGEAQHRDLLDRHFRDECGGGENPSLEEARGMMEGGIDSGTALAWARSHETVDVLEFTLAMEANACDRYIRIGRALGGATERVFMDLAEAERAHLQQLMKAFQSRRGAA